MSTTQATSAGRPPRSRGWLIAVVIVAVLIALVLYHSLTRKQAPKGTPPQVVKVAKAVNADMPEILNELGTVSPVATVTVLPQLSGYLTEVGYKEGQEVKKGQFLAQIDPRQYQINLEQAEATLLKDQATLDLARSDLARYHQLRDQKAIAEQTVVDQEFTVRQEEAQVKTDAASVAQYKLDLIYCHIKAPVDGRVGLRLVDPGNYVTASSSTGIVVITTMKPTTVQFTVAQNDLAKVLQRFGTGDKLPVTAYSSDNTRQIATGTLYAIGNQMATATGTVTLRAEFPNDDEALFPNEFVNVRILVDTLRQAVTVPTPAVLSGAPGDYVYLVKDDDTVTVRKIKLGPSDGQNTAILSGLQPGDTVVTDGTDRLNEGSKISVAGDNPEAAAAREGSSSGGSSGGGQEHKHQQGQKQNDSSAPAQN